MQDLATKFANLTIQSDFIFKKVMSRKRICKHLLEELLQIEIADINYIEAEKTIDPDYSSRGIRLDIIVADDKNTHYNLEMQVKNNKNPDTDTYVLPKRSRYYQALLDFDLLQKGQPYDLLPPTFIIFICVFDFFEQDNYVYTFKKCCLENRELELPDEATTMILNTKGTHGDISKDIKSFYDYVNNHIVTTDFTKQIDDEISYLKLDTKVRREYMLMEARLLDERREGEAVGIAKGKEIGFPGTGERTFWDSGNAGAAAANNVLTEKSTDMVKSGTYSAKLTSKLCGMLGFNKFAAGNLFAGTYVKTDGTDGVLSFGREYDGSHPTKMRVHVNYRPAPGSGEGANSSYIGNGVSDQAQIYVALSTEPVSIETKKAAKLFNKDDACILAYGERTFDTAFGPDGALEQVDIPFEYYEKAKTTGAKYLIIVCSASKFGDYFSGGPGSVMYLDDFELVYEQ